MLIEKTMNLVEIFNVHTGLPVNKYPHHIEAYEHFFRSFRSMDDLGLLEIGVSHGGSLQVWREYFRDNARIYGVDIQDVTNLKEKTKATEIYVGDQGCRLFWQKTRWTALPLDIVIDDGSHKVSHQLTTFQELFPSLRSPGLYICEDIHTSYVADYGGGKNKEGTFIEHLKFLLDDIHSEKHWFDGVFAVHVYPNLAIIEKRDPKTFGGPVVKGSL